jgi:tripartite-type tricarboxylate transporter receptor subunit TctC
VHRGGALFRCRLALSRTSAVHTPNWTYAYWDDIFARTLRTEEWKKFVDSAGWGLGYKNSQETAGYLRKEYD